MNEKGSFPFHLVDLTHELSEDTPHWSGGCGFEASITQDYEKDSTEITFRVQKINAYAGIGTHIDAPAHCIPGGKSIAQLRLTDLAVPYVVLDMSQQGSPDFLLSAKDIIEFEQQHKVIPEGSFVLVHTGWEQHWHHPNQFINDYQFPSVGIDAAELLLERGIKGLGIDTLSPDKPSSGYPVHQALLGCGKYSIENIANAGALPPVGSFILALPIKIKDGTEAPLRLAGLLQNQEEG